MSGELISDAPRRREQLVRESAAGRWSFVEQACLSSEETVRATAVGLLAEAGRADQPVIEAALGDPSVVVRRRLASVLGRVALLDRRFCSDGGSLDGDDSLSNADALSGGDSALLSLPLPLPLLHAALVVLLADADSTVQETAAWAAGECPQPSLEVLSALVDAALHHDDALCREAAVAALGAQAAEGYEVGREAVLAALNDIAPVRRRAVLALAAFEGPEIDDALRAALDDRDWQVRQGAEDLLGVAADALAERAGEGEAHEQHEGPHHGRRARAENEHQDHE